MSLPTRTTIDDLDAVCGYLATKPTGATSAEIRAVVDRKHLDARKIGGLKFWGLIEDVDGKTKITDRGRFSIRDSGAFRSNVLREVIRQVSPYAAIVERVVHRQESTLTASEVAAHWHEHFRNEVSSAEKILNDQALCFLQAAQGADLGVLTIGRRGLQTRFDFDADATRTFIDNQVQNSVGGVEFDDFPEEEPQEVLIVEQSEPLHARSIEEDSVDNNRVFITHGKNTRILEQVKELVQYGK